MISTQEKIWIMDKKVNGFMWLEIESYLSISFSPFTINSFVRIEICVTFPIDIVMDCKINFKILFAFKKDVTEFHHVIVVPVDHFCKQLII